MEVSGHRTKVSKSGMVNHDLGPLSALMMFTTLLEACYLCRIAVSASTSFTAVLYLLLTSQFVNAILVTPYIEVAYSPFIITLDAINTAD